MNPTKLLCSIGLVFVALGLGGCVDDNKSDGNAEAHAYVASCERLCDAQAAKNCIPGSKSIDDCKDLCSMEHADVQTCATSYRLYGLCTDNATDPCKVDVTCASELTVAKKECQPPKK